MNKKCNCKGDKMCKKCKKDYGDGIIGKCRKYINNGHGVIIAGVVSITLIVLSLPYFN